VLFTVGTALKDQTSLIPRAGKACLSSKEMRFPLVSSRSKNAEHCYSKSYEKAATLRCFLKTYKFSRQGPFHQG